MLKNNMDESQSQINTIKEFNSYFKFILGLAFLFCIPLTLNFFIDYSELNSRFFDAALMLFTFSLAMTFLAILIYTSPIIFQFIRHKSLTKSDFVNIANEQKDPTKTSFKIRRVFVWGCSIGAMVTLIVYIIYLIVLVIVSL